MENKSAENNYIYFINRNYYIVSHLAERLEELKDQHASATLKSCLTSTIKALQKQAVAIRDMLVLFNATDSYTDAQPTVTLLEAIFDNILKTGNHMEEIHLYDYVYLADSIMAETRRLAEISGKQVAIDHPQYQHLYDAATLKNLLTFLDKKLTTTVGV